MTSKASKELTNQIEQIGIGEKWLTHGIGEEATVCESSQNQIGTQRGSES